MVFSLGKSTKSGRYAYLDEGGTVCIFALMMVVAWSVTLRAFTVVPTFASANVLPFSRVYPRM
jgi:hypothetical protein